MTDQDVVVAAPPYDDEGRPEQSRSRRLRSGVERVRARRRVSRCQRLLGGGRHRTARHRGWEYRALGTGAIVRRARGPRGGGCSQVVVAVAALLAPGRPRSCVDGGSSAAPAELDRRRTLALYAVSYRAGLLVQSGVIEPAPKPIARTGLHTCSGSVFLLWVAFVIALCAPGTVRLIPPRRQVRPCCRRRSHRLRS